MSNLVWGCRAVSSHRLVPGDVVVLLPGKATCDMVLLRGCCLVEESLLSGEVSLGLALRGCCLVEESLLADAVSLVLALRGCCLVEESRIGTQTPQLKLLRVSLSTQIVTVNGVRCLFHLGRSGSVNEEGFVHIIVRASEGLSIRPRHPEYYRILPGVIISVSFCLQSRSTLSWG